MLSAPGEEIFDVKEVSFELPARAKIYRSQKCPLCNEITAEPWLRVKDGMEICIDCLHKDDPTIT